ncbi:MAG: tRNA (adenosine(37)-N6)-dimethylallyltransferase MiaA [bacterium]|nr:tRNA (adenosine(37)-N6)-dimethylallyltransferase MiaA [bacterium]
MTSPPLLVIAGPTASGKTGLALALAERLDGEIVSADSMQVYRGMEIGTAAPTTEEQHRVPHHLVGFLDPGESFCAGAFERRARRVIRDLQQAGKAVVVAGGSGLYVQALVDGLFPGPAADQAIRARLQAEAEEHGAGALYDRLAQVDPDYADVIHDADLRRIVRALEVYEIAGRPMSELHREHRADAGPLHAVQVALDYPRAQLYDRINARVDRMLEQGYVDEVRRLLDQGYESHLRRLRTLGYCEFAAHLSGEQSYDDAVAAMKRNTRRFAKRQLTWFRADKRIHWLPTTAETPPESHVDEVLGLLRNQDS